MKIDFSQFRDVFLQESEEHIASMEDGLLRLRSTPGDAELFKSIFRAAHSIKGGAGTFGMLNLVRFTHALENLLDRMRSTDAPVSDEVIGTLLRSVDVLRNLLGEDPNSASEDILPADALELVARIDALLPGDLSAKECDLTDSNVRNAPDAMEDRRKLNLYTVEFCPDRKLFSSGANPIVLLRNLAELGSVSCCHLHSEELPALKDLDPSQCYLSWTIELASVHSEAELREVFEFVEHLAEIRIQFADLSTQSGDEPAQFEGPSQNLSAASNRGRASVAVKSRSLNKQSDSGSESGSVRVAIDKVDRLIDLVGELSIAHVITAQMLEDFEPASVPKLQQALTAMKRITRELHERVMGIRMLPVEALFQRCARTTYEVSRAIGKQIRLKTSGGETEIDKNMLELLADPLTHLVRNAADHGIEMPEERLAAAKPAEGVITLRAFHRSGKVVIEIFDDGAGIDTKRIRAKALNLKLIGEEAQLSDEQLRLLIFEPGFSTREEITDLSGRGVGMDVVKRNVERLHGTVTLASEKGRGTSVSIELPLTLAVLEGLLVRVGERTLVLPLLSMIEAVPLGDGKVVRLADCAEMVLLRGESVPLMRLSRFLGVTSEMPAVAEESGNRKLAVIVESGNRKVGLVIDELLGQQQVVVKSLEPNLQRIDGLMGATILGDGLIAPIVDVTRIGALDLFSPQAPVENLKKEPYWDPAHRTALSDQRARGETAHELV